MSPKNTLHIVYKVRDGGDLPKVSTFMLSAEPSPVLYERPILSGVEVVWVSLYTLVCGDGNTAVV